MVSFEQPSLAPQNDILHGPLWMVFGVCTLDGPSITVPMRTHVGMQDLGLYFLAVCALRALALCWLACKMQSTGGGFHLHANKVPFTLYDGGMTSVTRRTNRT